MPHRSKKRAKLPAPRPASRQRRLAPVLARIAERSTQADPAEVRAYQPRELDVAVAEAMLAGAITQQELAAMVGCSPATVSHALRDPVVCGWVSMQVHKAIGMRLGLVDAAMLRRALGGDTRAADILYKRYGQMVERSLHAHVTVPYDLTKMNDAELETLAKMSKPLE
ncbi:MAG: hypothetical protein L0099_07340 [Acidobacteria bacterium]|nr:hypothetical protein [Acidobacteriota bacterium]